MEMQQIHTFCSYIITLEEEIRTECTRADIDERNPGLLESLLNTIHDIFGYLSSDGSMCYGHKPPWL